MPDVSALPSVLGRAGAAVSATLALPQAIALLKTPGTPPLFLRPPRP